MTANYTSEDQVKDIITRKVCPVCDSPKRRTVFKRSFSDPFIIDYMDVAYQGNADIDFLDGIDFELVKCSECSLGYQLHVLSDTRLNDLYNKWIDPKLALEWYQDHTSQAIDAYKRILTYVNSKVDKPASEIKVLDFGAGFGDSLKIAKSMNMQAYALEYSEERVEYLEKNGISVIDDSSDLQFDFILCNQVVEHITHPKELVANIQSKLLKGGIVYLAAPNCKNLEKNLQGINEMKDPELYHKKLVEASIAAFQHINFFNNKTLKLLLKMNGLRPYLDLKQIVTPPISPSNVLKPMYRYFDSTNLFAYKS